MPVTLSPDKDNGSYPFPPRLSHQSSNSDSPRNRVPKFQAKFGVAEEEPDGPREGLPSDPVSIPLPLKYPTPYGFPMGGCRWNTQSPLVGGGFAYLLALATRGYRM